MIMVVGRGVSETTPQGGASFIHFARGVVSDSGTGGRNRNLLDDRAAITTEL